MNAHVEDSPQSRSASHSKADPYRPPDLLDLLSRMEITKTVRFASSLRLRREKIITDLIINALSFAIAGFSIVSLVFANEFSPRQIAVVGTVTVIISVYIIILNYEFAKRQYDPKIVSLELSAHEIHELHLQLRFELSDSAALSSKEIEYVASKKYFEIYDSFLKRFPYVQEEIDSDYVLGKYPEIRDKAYPQIDKNIRKINRRYNFSHLYIAVVTLLFPIGISGLGILLLFFFAK